MDKNILNDYIDACKFIEEAEKELEKLKKRRQTVQDKVRGSNPEWPYEAKSFNVCGTAEKLEDAGKIQKEEQIIEEQKEVAEELKIKVEEWMKSIPFRMQRIIKYKFFERLPWETELIKARKESITGENENNDALDRLDQILKEVRDNAIKQETE